jgi:membrane glycosyltransferase
MALRMRQSLAEIERAFVEELAVDRVRTEQTLREAEQRQRHRRLERQHKHGTMRFVVLVLVLLATAIVVTVAMFETLYYVIG